MQNILKVFFLTALFAGLFNSTDAQRTRQLSQQRTSRVSSGSSRNLSSPSRQPAAQPAPQRSFNNNNRVSEPRITENTSRNMTVRNQSASTPQRNISSVERRNNTVINSPERTTVSRNSYNSYSRQNRVISSNYRYNNYRYNNYRYNNYRYNNRYYGNVYGHRTMFMYGPRYRIIPHSFISIHFGGYPYYYNRGYFYGYYGGYYQPIFPPFGLQINVLPFGYSTVFIGAVPFYYYNGIYYRQNESYYEVVDAPMGATVSSLPRGARSVVINGEKLYELNGTYYKADRDENGNDVFVVVGKNGVINNTADEQINQNLIPGSLEIGDTVSQLPEGSKVVTVNGQQLYETPDSVYLQEESVNGSVDYKVVGK
jgi:hypothetical protein